MIALRTRTAPMAKRGRAPPTSRSTLPGCGTGGWHAACSVGARSWQRSPSLFQLRSSRCSSPRARMSSPHRGAGDSATRCGGVSPCRCNFNPTRAPRGEGVERRLGLVIADARPLNPGAHERNRACETIWCGTMRPSRRQVAGDWQMSRSPEARRQEGEVTASRGAPCRLPQARRSGRPRAEP
jgi:hypothetical protein